MKCKAPGCANRAPGKGAFLCVSCWKATPKPLRDAAEKAYLRARQCPTERTRGARADAKTTLERYWLWWTCRLCSKTKVSRKQVCCGECRKYLRQSVQGKEALDQAAQINKGRDIESTAQRDDTDARVLAVIVAFTNLKTAELVMRRPHRKTK